MNGRGKSDTIIVPKMSSNKGRDASRPAEKAEERSVAKGNPQQHSRSRTQRRGLLRQALRWIRQVAERRKEERFTALWHHIYSLDRLREAYNRLNRTAAPGVDRATWKGYGEELEKRLIDLSGRMRRGAYRAKPVERTYILKEDGRRRPIGKPTLEDKIVQRSFTEVVGAVYEAAFKGFSYAFRPERSPHDALDALAVGIEKKNVNWVLDADIRGFFDAIVHEWMMKFLQHRIADKRVLRQVREWLRAGVMEDGEWTRQPEGTPQGGSASPLLANIYLHYVFDLWADLWRRRKARGDIIIVRYADDFVVGFQHRADAEHFQSDLKERLSKFGLELNKEKTRLIEFGRFATERSQARGEGKPETFTFLGFTHICSTNRRGRFVVLRQTMSKRLRGKLKAIKIELRKRLHYPIPEVGKWLGSVLRGHYYYYGVPRNSPALQRFYRQVVRLWFKTIRRRSNKSKTDWERMKKIARRWLPPPRIIHPYPNQRLGVWT